MQLSIGLALAALTTLGYSLPAQTITLDDPTQTITSAPTPTDCYTHTTSLYPTASCPVLSTCINVECIEIQTTTMPCPTLTCPVTETETAWETCTTTCRSGCATTVTATTPEVCPLATEV